METMTGKKFPYLTYILSGNFVKFTKNRTLCDIVLETLILIEFNTPEIRNKVIKFSGPNDEGINELFKEIENKANRRMEDYIPSYLLKDIKKAIQFIGSQIYFLFGKITNEEDRSLFLQYMAVNVSGTINISNTVRDILEKSNYSDEWKFLFSCKYFAREEMIIYYFKRLPLSVIQWCTQFRHSDCFDHCYQLCFYLWHFGENTEVFSGYIDRDVYRTNFKFDQEYNAKVIKLSFEMALRNGNENGVQFIFQNYILNSLEKNNILGEVFTEIHKNNFDMANIAIYLVSQMDDGELPLWFDEKCLFILEILFEDNRFHVALIKMVNDLQNKLADKGKLTSLLHRLMLAIDKMENGFKRYAITDYRETFMKVIETLSNNSRDCIFNSERARFDKLLKYAFDKMEGKIAIKLLTEIIPDTAKKRKNALVYITDTDSKNSFWTVALSRYDTNFIEEVFSAFLHDVNAQSMRTWLFAIFACNLFHYFIVNYKFENINSFIKWARYPKDRQIEYTKKEIREHNLLSIVKTIIFGVEPFQQNEINIFFNKELCKTNTATEEDPIEYIEKIFQWCLKNSESVVNYKRYLHRCLETSFYDYIKKWVVDKKYDQLDMVLAWLSNSGKSSISIKRKLCTDLSILEEFCDKDLQDEYLCFIDRYYSIHWTLDNLKETWMYVNTKSNRVT